MSVVMADRVARVANQRMGLAFARPAGSVAFVDRGREQTADLFARAEAGYASARELHFAAKLMTVSRLARSDHKRDRPSSAAGSVGRHGPGRDGSGHRLQKRLPRSEIGPRLARHALVDWLDDALSRDDLRRATLAVSELATNAVRHGKGAIMPPPSSRRGDRRGGRLRLPSPPCPSGAVIRAWACHRRRNNQPVGDTPRADMRVV